MSKRSESYPSYPPQTLDLRPVPRDVPRDVAPRPVWWRRHWHWLAGAVVVVVGGGLVGGAVWLAAGVTQGRPFPGEVVDAARFPLLYFGRLPAGYSINKSDVHLDGGVLQFQVKGPDGKSVSVSEQARPSDYDFSQLQGDEKFRTDIGDVSIGYRDDYSSASVAGPQTWLLMRASKPVTAEEMELLTKNVRLVKR